MTTWSDQHVDKLKALWTQGETASSISAQLGNGVSRSAVLGKIHRLNLNATRPPIPKQTKPRRPRNKTAPRSPSLALVPRGAPAEPRHRPPPIALEPPVPTGKVTIVDLSDKVCRWPIGDVGAEDFHFCGADKASDAPTPYCPYHAQKAVAAIQPKRYSASAFRSAGSIANVR